jgi:RNA polymerase sigma factor (TIGR02999 family)
LLVRWGQGDAQALEQLIPAVETELRRIADWYMRRERRDHTLQATALVNEAYLRLVDVQRIEWRDRAHFLAMAARVMRRVLVDHARARNSRKRGGSWVAVTLAEESGGTSARARDLIALDDALDALAAVDERKGRVIELRFFGGLSVEETASVLNVSTHTVLRDWSMAKAWLARELGKSAKA